MTSRILEAARAAAWAIALGGSALAHGGAYVGNGPGAVDGSTGIPAPTGGPLGPGVVPLGPSTGGGFGGKSAATGNDKVYLTAWQDWWYFNRDSYLDLKRAVRESSPATRGDDLEAEMRGREGDPALVSEALVRRRIAPALAKLLEGERSNEIVGATLIALARLGEPSPYWTVEASGAAVRGTGASANASVSARAGAGAGVGSASTSRAETAVAAQIARFLADPNQETVETAALALGVLGGEDALPFLEPLLSGDERGQKLVGNREVSPRTRAFAAYGLGLVARQAKNNRTRQIVARALTDVLEGRARNGRSTDPRAPSPDLQVAAVLALSLDPLAIEPVESASAPWISRQTLLHFLEGLFAEPRRHAFVRAHAATAIARLAQDAPEALRAEAAEILLAAVRARRGLENEVLQSCTQALGLLGDSDADKLDREIRNALVLLLDEGDAMTRSFALIALAEIGARAGPGDKNDEGLNGCRNAIAGELARGRRWMRPWAALALGVLERRILDREEGRAGLPWSIDRSSSAAAGGPVGGSTRASSESMRELLRGFLAESRARDQVGAAAIALGLCRDERAVPALIARVRDSSEDTGQGYVAIALGMIGAEGSVEPLRALAKSSKNRMGLLEDVSIALALLGDRNGANELVDRLPQATGQAAQVSLANAIGFVGDARAVDPLLRAIEGHGLTSSTRAFAVTALGRIADADLFPWWTPVSLDLNYNARPATLIAGDGTGLLEIL